VNREVQKTAGWVAARARKSFKGLSREAWAQDPGQRGSLLEPVGDLAEIVGFRSIRSRDGAADKSPPGTHQRMAARVDDIFARREATLAQERPEVGRWLDDGGSCSPEALAEAMALPKPKQNP
jgi:hypothetical protein